MSSSNEKISLSTFPSDRTDALTILYLQNQDLSGKTPEELANMYDEVRHRIFQEFILISKKHGEEHRKKNPYTPIF